MIKTPALIVFLMPFHTIALALPDVKSTNVTIYDKGQIYIEKSGKKD
jgi:hypothetical protein